MYSQNREEEIILDYFLSLHQHTLSILDIGANDGVTLSNSRALIERGAMADLVEPSPAAFAKLTALYKDNSSVSLHQVAIGQDGETVLYESGSHLNKGDVGLLSSTVRSELNRWKNETFTPVKVKSLSFDSFLQVASLKEYDFINIDAEGNDLFILQQMDLAALGCKCLCIEWNGIMTLLASIMTSCYPHGLRLHHKNAENLIFCK